MDSQTLQQFEEDIRQAINETLKTSSIGTVLTKYGIPDNVLTWECSLDVSKLKSSNGDESQPGQELMAGIQKPPVKLANCTMIWCEECCPDGCWMCI
ncbi:hypothetical protein [Fortiea contorta]|uniref:hypothetical protein n=1 Tax=Fortiea contorta TaxID=1892405 RepID=UPI00034B3668|nr:hypothetical protein [Fortiea contorta]